MVKFQVIPSHKWEEPANPWIKVDKYEKLASQGGHTYELIKYERPPGYLDRCLSALKALWLILSSCGQALSGKKVQKLWDQTLGRKPLSCRFGKDAFASHTMTLKQLMETSQNQRETWNVLHRLTQTTIKASKPEYCVSEALKNGAFNRYPDILPYDKNVVKTADGRYLNCSKIEMHGFVRFLAQGPIDSNEIKSKTKLKSTVGDFLSLVREQKVKILCLTNHQEDSKIKCAHYWAPDINIALSGGYQCLGEKSCTILAEKEGQRLLRRELKVIDSKGVEVEPIVMDQIENWNDHHPPAIDLIKELHKHIASNEPHLVHCSAGVGRTGTWVAIEMLCKEIDDQLQKGVALDEVKINIPNTILELRKQRIGLVWTEGQFGAVVDYIKHYYQQKLGAKV